MRLARTYWLVLPLIALIVPTAPLGAHDTPRFQDLPPRLIVEAPFADRDVDALVATLDGLLQYQTDPDQWGLDAGHHLWSFVERLQNGALTAAQEARVEAHLDAIARQHPDDASVITKYRYVVSSLTVGKVAPDIVAKDLDGQELRLSDYRGRVVVLAFSGEWCGACRLEYPYQKLLIDLYKDRPLTILSVNSDRDPKVAKQAKADRGLTVPFLVGRLCREEHWRSDRQCLGDHRLAYDVSHRRGRRDSLREPSAGGHAEGRQATHERALGTIEPMKFQVS